MKLYLRSHLEVIALKKWDTFANLEEERQRRVTERIRNREKKARQAHKNIDKVSLFEFLSTTYAYI